MNKKVKIIGVAVLVLCGAAVYWMIQAEPPAPQPNGGANEAPPPLSYVGNTISEEKDGQKVWELTAEVIELDAATNNMILKNIQGVFHQPSGENVTLTAPKAIYSAADKNIVISQRVKAVTSGGAALDADEVRWDETKALLSGRGNVRLTKEDTVVTGDQIESSDGFTRFKVMGNAHIIKGGTAR